MPELLVIGFIFVLVLGWWAMFRRGRGPVIEERPTLDTRGDEDYPESQRGVH